jgi:hypothetical protein
MRKVVLVFDEKRTSVEALSRLLQGSGFAVRPTTRGATAPQASGRGRPAALAPEHRARELLSRVEMLARCLQLSDVTAAELLRWPAEIADANRQLDALYADGLGRDFRGEPSRWARPPQSGVA